MRGRRSPWSLLRLAEQKASRGPPMYFGRQHSFAAATPGLVSDEAAVRRGDDAIQDGVRRATLLVAIALLVATVAAPVTPRSRLGTSADVSFTYEDGSVLVHLPAHAARIGVIVLHSFGHTAAEPASQGWSTAADRHRFVALYPERGTSWNAGLCCGSAADEQRDDVSWLAGAITLAQTKYHLQTIYLVGFSNGGMMVERLVAERPELSDRFAVWGAAPEMPSGGHWTRVRNSVVSHRCPPEDLRRQRARACSAAVVAGDGLERPDPNPLALLLDEAAFGVIQQDVLHDLPAGVASEGCGAQFDVRGDLVRRQRGPAPFA
jgi:pimeloyl-ACP methyl ester carboxylesterase